jgi:hypothetical protein
MPPSQTPYVPRKNKTARLNHPSGCMTAAACDRIPNLQRPISDNRQEGNAVRLRFDCMSNLVGRDSWRAMPRIRIHGQRVADFETFQQVAEQGGTFPGQLTGQPMSWKG